MTRFETITPQPDFPNEDLAEQNVALLEFFLREMHEATTHARFLQDTMRPIHQTAHYALQLSGVNVAYTPSEYASFCEGFAAFEYMSLLVNPRYRREQLMIKNVHLLFTSGASIPEIDIADRRQAWMQMYPNTTAVITSEQVAQNDTLPELYSRAIGAQIACELQMAA